MQIKLINSKVYNNKTNKKNISISIKSAKYLARIIKNIS